MFNIANKKTKYNPFIEIKNINCLCDYFNFKKDFTIIENNLNKIRFIEDINNRRKLDAEILSLISANAIIGNMLDIGTYFGHSTARMATNSPQSKIFTVNIHPNKLKGGGKLTTGCPPIEQIGLFYKQKNIKNIQQYFADTKTWKIPKKINNLTLVYIDGCHDKNYIYNDTVKILDKVVKGGFILWHDCSPIYRQNFPWINESMSGIEKLIIDKKINGYILNVKNSWIGIWKKI